MRRLVPAGVVLALLCSLRAEAGPWVPEMGHGLVHAGLSGGYASEELSGFQREETGRLRMASLDLYGEVGVLPRTAITVALPLRYVDVQPSAEREELVFDSIGAGDLDFRVEVAALTGRIVLTPHLGLRAPLYALAWDRPALGPGTIDFEGGLGAGIGLGDVYGFAEVAYRLRGKQPIPDGNALVRGESLDVADQVAATVELGARAFERLWIIINLDAEIAVAATANNPGADAAFLESFGLRPQTSRVVLELKTWIDLTAQDAPLGHAVTAGIWTTIAGDKTAAAYWGSLGYGLTF